MSNWQAIKENLHGCSNHSCVIKKPVGMGTNGQCHCLDDRIKLQKFAYIRNEEIKHQQSRIDALEAQVAEAKAKLSNWKPTEKEIANYASVEELYLFASESDLMSIAIGILELVQIKINGS